MKERPIIICIELIPRVLDGSKTQTRRVIKPQPSKQCDQVIYDPAIGWKFRYSFNKQCPYGQVGDRLWVRETFAYESPDGDRYVTVTPNETKILYHATDDWEGVRVPSIHMPRWASRIDLEITAIRVERLQGITEGDAIAEGFGSREDFRVGWNRLNAKWKRVYNPRLKIYEFWQFPWCEEDAKPIPKTTKHPERYHCCPDPWVWVIEFKRIHRQEMPIEVAIPERI